MFKVGDKVITKKSLQAKYSWVSYMEKYVGKETEIIELLSDGYLLKDIPYSWCDNTLEPVKTELKDTQTHKVTFRTTTVVGLIDIEAMIPKDKIDKLVEEIIKYV